MPLGLEPFETAKTYADLIAANVLFLEGTLRQSPYHYGPIDKETEPILQDLIKLNKLGFITVQSQPAGSEVGFVNKIWYVHGEQMGNWWYASEKKPFVEGYLPINELERFIQFMRKYPEYYYNIYTMENNSTKGLFGRFFKEHRIDCILSYTNMPKLRVYNLTREKCSATKLGLNSIEWEHYTNLWATRGIDYDFTEYPNIAPIVMGHSVKVLVMGKEYNHGSVIDLMLEFYNKKTN